MPADDVALSVYYDGACPLCSREVASYRRARGAEQVRWVDVTATADLPDDLPRAQALGRLHAIGAGGERYVGVDAFRAIWRTLPGFHWLARLASVEPVRRLVARLYEHFVNWRAPRLRARDAFTSLPLWLQRELRANQAGEAGAVVIYDAIGRWTRRADIRALADTHGATERGHLEVMNGLVPPRHRSRLLPLWRTAGYVTGFVAGASGPRTVMVTVDAVETFVDAHYARQLERLAEHPGLARTSAALAACLADERLHRDEARAALPDRRPGLVERAWRLAIALGSQLAVGAARRL